jgi:hypothetical protein
MEEIRRMQEEIEREEMSLLSQRDSSRPVPFQENFLENFFDGFVADGTLGEIFPSRNT